jgi:hypothetical protein
MGQTGRPTWLLVSLFAFAVLSGCKLFFNSPLSRGAPPFADTPETAPAAWFHQTPDAARQIIADWCAETEPWYLLAQSDQRIACWGDHPITGLEYEEASEPDHTWHSKYNEWVTFTLTPEGAGTCVTVAPEVRRITLERDDDSSNRYMYSHYPRETGSTTNLEAVLAGLGGNISTEHQQTCRLANDPNPTPP